MTEQGGSIKEYAKSNKTVVSIGTILVSIATILGGSSYYQVSQMPTDLAGNAEILDVTMAIKTIVLSTERAVRDDFETRFSYNEKFNESRWQAFIILISHQNEVMGRLEESINTLSHRCASDS